LAFKNRKSTKPIIKATNKEIAMAINCFLKLKKSPLLKEELKIDNKPKQLSKKAGTINFQLIKKIILLKLISLFPLPHPLTLILTGV